MKRRFGKERGVRSSWSWSTHFPGRRILSRLSAQKQAAVGGDRAMGCAMRPMPQHCKLDAKPIGLPVWRHAAAQPHGMVAHASLR